MPNSPDLGYLAGAHPMSVGQQKLPVSKFTAFNITVWGVVVCLLAVGPNFAALMGIRLYVHTPPPETV